MIPAKSAVQVVLMLTLLCHLKTLRNYAVYVHDHVLRRNYMG